MLYFDSVDAGVGYYFLELEYNILDNWIDLGQCISVFNPARRPYTNAFNVALVIRPFYSIYLSFVLYAPL